MKPTLKSLIGKRVHFIGIGGAGMSGLARIALSHSIHVSGSDNKDSSVVKALVALGASIATSHSASNVDGADLVVFSTAISPTNPELTRAHELGIDVLTRAAALSILMSESTSIAVAGTHGKTTTSSMLAVALQACGADPSFAIGGTITASGSYLATIRPCLDHIPLGPVGIGARTPITEHPSIMHFDRFGLAFDYPDNWLVDTDDSADRYATVTVYAPGGGFWSVSGHAPGGDPRELSAAVVVQMKREYQDLDSEEASDGVGGQTLPGFDMNFYCLDLTNTAQVRTLETPDAIYLIICQAEDREWDEIAAVFAAMTTSFVAAAGVAKPDDGDD